MIRSFQCQCTNAFRAYHYMITDDEARLPKHALISQLQRYIATKRNRNDDIINIFCLRKLSTCKETRVCAVI